MSGLRALFVSDRTDAPHRYRCVHACAQLRASGAVANVVSLDDPGLPAAVDAYSVVVLFRLPWGDRVEALVERARRAGVPLVFDCDDLTFDPQTSTLFPFRSHYTQSEWAQSYGFQLRAQRRTFDACDMFIGSTPTLAAWAQKLGKPARSHPNVVPDAYLRLAPLVRRARAALRPGPTIGYFSGSNTHDADFESIVPALRRVLETSDARLLIGGFLDVGTLPAGFEHRVVRLPHLGFRVLPWAFAACDVTIAPLAAINAFTDGKSALKMFEPGVFGVPVVATPTAEMRRFIQHGASGWLADGEAAWIAALESALVPATSTAVGEAARHAVLSTHTSRAVSGRLATLLGEVAIHPVGVAPPERPFVLDEYSGRTDRVSHTVGHARRFREIARVSAVVRARIPPQPALADADALVEQALAGSVDGAKVLIVGSPQASGWRASAQIENEPGPFGEQRVTGQRHYLSPEFELRHEPRYAVIRMRATSDKGRGVAQLFWRWGRRRDFAEEASARFSVTANGIDSTYVVDLWGRGRVRVPRGRSRRVQFRLDPLDRVGTTRVVALALMPEGWRPGVVQAPGRSLPTRSLGARPRDARRVLKAVTRAMQAEESTWLESPRDTSWLRRWLTRELAGSGCQVERIEQAPTGSRALVRRDAVRSTPGVDIVVPVFNAREQTLRCLRSVMRHARGDFRLVVIDDASTDPELWPELERFAADHGRVVLHQNDKNLGFSGTCNRALAAAGDRDVLLLNSDTIVFRGFLEQLCDTAHAAARNGIVCPLSNNATICSVPAFCQVNRLPEGMSAKRMAALVRRGSRKRRPELVTAVGFCMYVRAEVLADVGRLDAERFSRGFGEENDFAERAKAAGWKIRLADDTYVWHDGKASFGEEGFALEAANAPVLEARHPGYHAAVARFIQDNPLAPIHDELRWQLARSAHASRPTVLMLLHASPFREACGGTEWIVRDLLQHLRLPRAVVAYPGDSCIEVAELLDGDCERLSVHRFPLKTPVPRFCHEHAEAAQTVREVLRLFRIGHVHVHHLMNWPLSIDRTLREAGVPYSMTVHDFYGVCPSQNLLDPARHVRCCPASIGDDSRTLGCMRGLFAELALPEPGDLIGLVSTHRKDFRRWLDGASAVFFPSSSARQIVESVYPVPGGRARVLPHGYVPRATHPGSSGHRHDKLRVALIGEISYASKGADGYLEVMGRLAGEPIEWHVFGTTERFDFERRLRALGFGVNVVRHGAYARDDIVDLLQAAGIDVGLMLPIWPETFSLTLSELLAAGVPVVATDQGALGERLQDKAYARLVSSAGEAAAVLGSLCRKRDQLRAMRSAVQSVDAASEQDWVDAHREHYAAHHAGVKSSRLRRRELLRLLETRVAAPRPGDSLVTTTTPAPRFRAAGWYRRAEKLKPYLPESIRALARHRLSDERFRVLQRFRIPGRRARSGGDAQLDARYLSTAAFSSPGGKPFFYLDIDPIAPDDVSAFRFNIWSSHHGHAYARVYWRHDTDTAFSEEKSVRVELNSQLGDWQDYVVRLDRKLSANWYAGRRVVAMRFDPVSYAGPFCVGRFALCAPAAGR